MCVSTLDLPTGVVLSSVKGAFAMIMLVAGDATIAGGIVA